MQPRTRLDLLKPSTETLVENRQMKRKVAHYHKARERTSEKGEVYTRSFETGNTWILGEIVETRSSVLFLVKCVDGKLIRRHQDHLRHCKDDQVLEQSGKKLDQSRQVSDDVWVNVSSNNDTPEQIETQPSVGGVALQINNISCLSA